MAISQPSTPFVQETLADDYENDLIFKLSSVLNCSPFDPILVNLNVVQIRWILEVSARKSDIYKESVQKEESVNKAESMAKWQAVLTPEAFREKLYKGEGYRNLLKNLESFNGKIQQ